MTMMPGWRELVPGIAGAYVRVVEVVPGRRAKDMVAAAMEIAVARAKGEAREEGRGGSPEIERMLERFTRRRG
ncbi:hypothetical protein A3K55_02485 [Candidatus Shapirobacteria bacterium RBG_13_44_7]|uniref:Uncharacterized protein n=1 Tax=Candidatus Shapirobacteria bacterium RBG_13_44_7 TaxID=1802149 RepID=A0A1F7SKI5_9BACT|nr:MAG: hypothetical protein A3K55_02485 [Candidatus Shapirobacteria bacterium RBG_13_44_7]